MQSHELLREIFENTNVKCLASEMRLSQSLVYKWAEGGESGATNPLDRVELLSRYGGERIVQWLCESAGGFFCRNPKRYTARTADIMSGATSGAVKELSEMIGLIATASAGGKIDREDAVKLRREWEKVKGMAEGFVVCAEDGKFAEKA